MSLHTIGNTSEWATDHAEVGYAPHDAGGDDLVEGKPTRTADAKRRGAEAARQLLVGCGYFEKDGSLDPTPSR